MTELKQALAVYRLLKICKLLASALLFKAVTVLLNIREPLERSYRPSKPEMRAPGSEGSNKNVTWHAVCNPFRSKNALRQGALSSLGAAVPGADA